MEDDRLLILANTYDQHVNLLQDFYHGAPISGRSACGHNKLRALLRHFLDLTAKWLRQCGTDILLFAVRRHNSSDVCWADLAPEKNQRLNEEAVRTAKAKS